MLVVHQICTLIAELAAIFLVIFASIGVSNISSDNYFTSCTVNYKIMFGFGIAIGLVSMFIAAILFCFTGGGACAVFFFFIFTIPGIPFVIFLGSPKYCLNNQEDFWLNNTNGIPEYQVKHRCCGWENSSDHALLSCPFRFESGCKEHVQKYFDTKFNHLFAGHMISLIAGAVSIITVALSLIHI